ncbi:MAG: hypothetical protein ACNS62_09595 [Candidatus Cyclobacteriaceae bacterium M3_2C_046]
MRPIRKSNLPDLLLIFLFLKLISCQSPSETKEQTGKLDISYIQDIPSAPLQPGQILKINMMYQNEADSVIADSKLLGGPFFMQFIDSVWQRSGLVYQAIRQMTEGDSITFQVPAQDFYHITAQDSVPGHLKDTDLTFYVGLEQVMSPGEYQDQYLNEQP